MRSDKSPFALKELKIEVTHDCMLQCIHCSSDAIVSSGRSMEWRSCERLLDDASIMGVKEIAFSGGEPLLWEHMLAAVEKASNYGIEAFLYTTGNAPNAQEALNDLRIAGLSRTMFSLFDVDEEKHEKITGVKGSYRKTLDAASYCASVGFETEFHFVPLSHNYRTLCGIAELGRQYGVKRISVLRLVPQGRGKCVKDRQLSYFDNLELRKMIVSLRAAGHDIRLGSPYNFLMLREKPVCHSGIDRMTVGPDLRIFPCDAFKHISPEDIGANPEYSSLEQCSLAECWEKSSYLATVRRYLTTDLAAECKICHNLEVCNSGCVAQKFYAWGELRKCPDPLCLAGNG